MARNDKQKKQCQQNCSEHNFLFKPGSSKCWNKLELNVNYCPQYNEQDLRLENIVPILNNDNQPCMPGFILQLEKTLFQFNFHKHLEEHNKKIQEYAEKKQELFFPKPNKRHRYCGVCKLNYEEYLEHIKSQDHKIKFSQNKHTAKIEQFARELNPFYEDPNQISDQVTSQQSKLLSNSANQISTAKNEPVEVKKRRGRPKLSEEEKMRRKKERDFLKSQGLAPVKKVKAIDN